MAVPLRHVAPIDRVVAKVEQLKEEDWVGLWTEGLRRLCRRGIRIRVCFVSPSATRPREVETNFVIPLWAAALAAANVERISDAARPAVE